jgi:polar amino acid transport system permease protein
MTDVVDMTNPAETAPKADIAGTWRDWRTFPYWLLGIVGFLGYVAYLVLTQERYENAWDRIIPGLRITIETTIWAFVIALVFGLLLGLGRISRNIVLRNVSIFYIEFIRGVPVLVLIFTIAYAVVPTVADAIGFDNNTISFQWRAIIALAAIYAAYLAEIFRAGIESISKGQTEAGRALGMSHGQTLRRIVLPQAVRNITPALGNDAIAMLKDTSLVSVLAVRDITQNARIFAGSSFDYKATYPLLVALYLSMTVTLSLLLSWYRRRLGLEDRG